ncbi:sugar phosphate isomerase/epimerase family protein [Plantactinospora siamensis]|uniref:Sugar phosphate isomerase/epimerase family protein n=1 Tax=Plantactinospora siamensis TaxID=555372 RepID=A0ABV6NVK5_9ACTN
MSDLRVPDRRPAFSTLGASGEPLDQVVHLARAAGLTGVELRCAPDEPIHPGLTAEQVESVARTLDAGWLSVLALSGYVRLCAPDDDFQLIELTRQLTLAAAVGAAGVRVFMGDEDGTGEPRARRRLAAAAPQAARLGVRILIETHDSHAESRRLAGFIGTLDADTVRAVGVIWDTAHTWRHGESPARSLDLLAPYLAHLQVKDVASDSDATPVPLGSGRYPVRELGAALDAVRWRGWVCLEWERKWQPGLPPIREALERFPGWAAAVLGVAATGPEPRP